MRTALATLYRKPLTAWLVLAAGVCLSAAAAMLLDRQLERAARLKFESAVADARAAIESRISDYAEVLLGVRGLFAAADTVSRDAFKRYIDNLDLLRRFPGIQVIHYSRPVSAAELPTFIEKVRGDTSVDARGYPNFRVRPPGERPHYMLAEYVEPMAGNERGLGLDLGGDPVRLAALERTRDSGQLTASGAIAVGLDPSRHPGFAMRLALYRRNAPLDTVEQRREAFVGVVSTSFVALDLMRGVLAEPFLKDVHVRIHDAGFLNAAQGLEAPAADNLMFDSDRLAGNAPPAQAGQRSALASSSALQVGGRVWHLYFTARAAFDQPSRRWLPWAVMLGGTFVSLLLFGLIRSLASSGTRAIALAERITQDLRRSEETLRAALAQLQTLVQSSPLAIYTRDRNGLLTSWNPAAEKMYGWKESEVLGKPLPSVPGEVRAQSDELRLRLLAGEQFIKHEARRVRRDGSPIDVDAFLAPLRDGQGNSIGIIAVVTDITERKQVERALRESEARYRSVVAAIAEGLVLHDRERRIVDCNASAEHISGRTLEQMRGLPAFDPGWQVIREDGADMPQEERPVYAAWRTGSPQSNVTVGFRRPDAGVLWLSVNAQPLFDDGELSGIVTTMVDITARKQVEQRQAMEHGITRLLAESETLDEVMPRLIRTVCEALGCACGTLRTWHPAAQTIARAGAWGVALPEVQEFLALGSEPVRLQPEEGGLLRRVLASGEPAWITDVTLEASFRRAPQAVRAGLKGAFAFPIRFGNETLGVMEFFSRDSRAPDEVLMQSTRAIGSQIGQFMARRQAEERVRHLAHYDELTGLPNRAMFHQRVGHALAQARRNPKSLAILFIDLDRFKNINDSLGHDAGDLVLTEVAGRLRGCLRESDTIGRLGGDEFVVLIEDLPQAAQVAEVARKILAEVARPVTLGEQEFHLTASIGISAFPGDAEDMQGMMKNADIAMYRAKEQGKNTYQFYSSKMNVHTVERLALESALRRALERDEFLLHFQPKVDIRSGRITGMEALVRWQHPERGLMAPGLFIPLAEETGLIVPLGAWVLSTACARIRAWQHQGVPAVRVAVNLSARQFAGETLVQDVAKALADTGLDPASLELEITESMVMRNPGRAARLLGEFKAMGIHLAIDDFGTGYSSLSYLKRFPINSLKIDRSFVQNLPRDGDDAAITEAIIAMAHSLRIRVIAEGVENESQLRFLREHDCDEMQGYLFSRPVPEGDAMQLLKGSAGAGARTGIALVRP